MIQEIYPYVLDNHYDPNKEISENDYVFVFDNKTNVLVFEENNYIPTLKQLKNHYDLDLDKMIYLFSISDEEFYLYDETLELKEGYAYINRNPLKKNAMWARFAHAVALHLKVSFSKHQYCGCCGSKMKHDKVERAMRCPNCNMVSYPIISPGIIVAVLNEDKICLTKYRGREYTNFALIAGFTEIGETLEECVIREVKEEVGLNVKNVRYFGNQPWPYSQSLLVGYVCELDGDDTITLEENELKEGGWYRKDEIPPLTSDSGITQTIMQAFMDGKLTIDKLRNYKPLREE